MGKTTGACDICHRKNLEVFRCKVCGSNACSRDFMADVQVCSTCVRKGLWVGPDPET